MAPLSSSSKLLLLYLVLFLLSFLLFSSASSDSSSLQSKHFLGSRRFLEVNEEDEVQSPSPKKKISNLLTTKNQTKLTKPNLSAKNQTIKLIKDTNSLLKTNKTKLSSNSTKFELKKLNSTSHQLIKKLNSTSKSNNSASKSIKKMSDLLKSPSPSNKTTKPISNKDTLILKNTQLSESQTKNQKTNEKKPDTNTKTPPKSTKRIDPDMEDDLVAEFRDLPSKFQQSLIPDLERISITSQKYLTKANKEMTRGFKPIVGTKYASITATVVSFAFITIPLLLVSLVFNRIKAYFSVQKIVIFIQVYLSIYFSILCVSSLVTGLEPLKFFYATSQSTYVCLMVLQTLGYVLYLLLLLMYFILVFSTESGLGSKLLGLGQIVVGFAVGLHFYVAVFHRVVLHQPPKTNWKVHGIYATCFLVICLLSKFDRRKKAYLEEGGEEGKKN
ncbi:uncharacterized protein LOC126656615 [Mercurialis annua]|uniref:uncharacterized protein LOC126656615 n=1 Tax=Mercurialis annua TaxID=3986 RepID=UPI00215F9608|nr:uncharacterized protein LOC126656615 [Mercurialis annua]